MVKKVNVLSAIFEKYPKVLCCHTFLCRVNYRWSQSWMFYQPFLRNIPKCYVFTPFCAGLTTGGQKMNVLSKLNVWSSVILKNIPKCYVFTPFCAGLTTGGHKVECFISHFEKYPKMLCFHTFLCRVNYRWSQSFISVMFSRVNVLSVICMFSHLFAQSWMFYQHCRVECFISHFWEISQNVMFSHLFATIHM